MSPRNARQSGVAETIPSLPAKSVDFDALQAALRAGKSGEEAVKAATVKKPEPAPVPAAEPDPAPATPETTEE